jgi:D-arabinose 1-dehydrogenase-like Zn-dependent alcohol dehydrogenase
MVGTYNSRYANGGKSYGGYATYNRTPSRFVIKIPDGISSAEAAPMPCAGATTYVPLKNYGCGPGKKVGIIGLGGLGHFGLLWAKALGADYTVVIGRNDSKREDALKLGADKYVATNDEKNWATENARSVDLLVSSVSSAKVCSRGTVPRIPLTRIRCLSPSISLC